MDQTTQYRHQLPLGHRQSGQAEQAEQLLVVLGQVQVTGFLCLNGYGGSTRTASAVWAWAWALARAAIATARAMLENLDTETLLCSAYRAVISRITTCRAVARTGAKRPPQRRHRRNELPH